MLYFLYKDPFVVQVQVCAAVVPTNEILGRVSRMKQILIGETTPAVDPQKLESLLALHNHKDGPLL